VYSRILERPNPKMKIIGAGFGRTGTLSLKTALEELGFGPCYHMQGMMSSHRDHIPLWSAVADGELSEEEFKAMLKDYNSGVDWPVCIFYKELMEMYPESKIILTVRSPESWYSSFSETIMQTVVKWNLIMALLFRSVLVMMNKVVYDRVFHGRKDREYCTKIFIEHIEQVKATVPKERLLVFDVKEGWKPLCQFLGVEEPNTPFPRMNERAQMPRRILMISKVSTIVVMATVVAGVAFGISWILRKYFL